MRPAILVSVIAVFIAFTESRMAAAQQASSELRGRVIDEQRAVLPAVAIVVRNEDSGMFRETLSGSDGSFFLGAMTPGKYEISAQLDGFKKYTLSNIKLEVGKTTSVEIQLELGGIEETITVTGESPLVDLTSKEVGGYIESDELIETPSVNRNFTGYIALLPGVVATVSTASFAADSVNINGQTVRNVNYSLDGSNNNDTFNLGNGGAQARIPIEAVQEFQLLTSQFDAEFGTASGGIINAVSKQGGNDIHGSVFGWFKDSALTAEDYFVRTQDLEKPETGEQQWGGSIGGPIIRDKAHFFFTLERIKQDRGVTINIPSRPEFNSAEAEEVSDWATFLRFDHQLNAQNTWGIRWLRETSPQFNQLNQNWTKAHAEEETDTDWTIVGTVNSVFGDTKVNTLRLSSTKEDVFFGNPGLFDNGLQQEILPPRLDQLTFFDQQSPRASRREDLAFAFDETFSWFVPGKRGDHDLKFGVQYLYSSLRFTDSGNRNGTFQFSTDLAYNPADPRTYPERLTIRVPDTRRYFMKGNFISAFAQDKWKLTDRLALSLGIRYDVEILPLPENDNPAFASPSDYPVDDNNFAPRVGFTFGMDEEGRSVLRGGYGRFYQRFTYTHLDEIITAGVFSGSFIASFPANQIDSGPSNGRFPTDPMLVNGPTVNRDLLDQMFPPGTRTKNTGNVFFDSPDRRQPYADQLTIGYERQLSNDLAISADYIHSQQRDLLMRRDLNPGMRASTSRSGRVVRPNPDFVQSVWEIGNDGWIDYDALQIQVDKRYRNGYRFRVAYTLSKGRGNTETGDNEVMINQLGSDLRLDMNEGPTSIDRRHNLVVTGIYEVPRTRGLRVSGVMRALSGAPFTLTDSSFDLDQNGFFENEFLPPGTYSGQGPDAITVENQGGRRGARGPGWFSIDLRAGYNFELPRGQRLEAFVDVLNLTNRANFENPTAAQTNLAGIADRRRSDFLVLTSLLGDGPTRTAQIGVRWQF